MISMIPSCSKSFKRWFSNCSRVAFLCAEYNGWRRSDEISDGVETVNGPNSTLAEKMNGLKRETCGFGVAVKKWQASISDFWLLTGTRTDTWEPVEA